MPLCDDPAISYLKSYGYSVLRLPRADFAPLQILAEQGRDLVPLGQLSTVIVPRRGAVAPAAKSDVPAPSINGRRSNEVSLGVGLGILGGLIGAMGGEHLELEATYEKAASLAFEFSDMLGDEIEIAALDQYLASADVDPRSRHVSTMLDANEVYVVTRTIKSTTFTVLAKKEEGVGLALDVPVVQEVVGAKVEVSAAGAGKDRIVYKGKTPLVFGFQAVQLFYDHGRYTAFEPTRPGEKAARMMVPPAYPNGVRGLATRGPFARLAD
jgi:hypothetical protein